MRKLTALFVVIVVAFSVMSPAFAGGPDGVFYQLWNGSTPTPPSKDLSFADCTLGSGWINTYHTDDLYVSAGGNKYSGYDLPYPTDEWHPVTWYVIVDIAQTSTLRIWSSAVHNPSTRYGVHGTNAATGEMVFHQPIYSEMITTTLEAGKYQFNTTASVVPEPGSIVAMLSGLAGLAGFAARRRK